MKRTYLMLAMAFRCMAQEEAAKGNTVMELANLLQARQCLDAYHSL